MISVAPRVAQGLACEVFTTHMWGEPSEVDEPETTVMLRKLPHDFARDRL